MANTSNKVEVTSPCWAKIPGIRALENTDLQDGRFSVRLDNGVFECYLKKNPGQFLFVLLSGARDPQIHPLPKFERWSWDKIFPGSILCINDPALYLKNQTLRIGWYAGTEKFNWPLRMAGLVSSLANKLGKSTRDIIVYGSSAGGFGSLMLAARLGDATAIAINPQTDVLKYSKRFVAEFLQTCFSGRTDRELLTKERSRLLAAPAILNAPAAKYVIIQNTLDKHHYEYHYKPFCQALGAPVDGGKSKDCRGLSMIYTHPSGHGREPQELVASIVKAGVELAQVAIKLLPTNKSDSSMIQPKRSDLSLQRIRARQLYLLKNRSQVHGNGIISLSFPGRSDLAPYSVSLPLDWDLDPYKDRNWCAQLHMWRMLDNDLIEFDRTEDASSLDLPLRFIDDWHRFHLKEQKSSKFAWMDMNVGLRAMKLAYIVSAYQAGLLQLKSQQIDICEALINAHLAFLMNPAFISYSNHTFIDMHGLAALRSIISGKKGDEIDGFLQDNIPKLISSQFNEQAVHLENSTGYQAFGIGCVKRLLNSGWFSQFKLDSLVSKASTVNDWFKMPDGRIIPVGDTDGAPMPSLSTSAFTASHELFNSSGYVIYRDDGNGKVARSSYLFFMGAFNSRFHKQADDLSITWFEGEDILCDAGKFAYKASEIRGFVQSTRAHNTIEVDGKSSGEFYSGKPHLVYGSAVKQAELTEWGFALSAEVYHKKSGVRHTRYVFYRCKNWLLLIDKLTSIDGRTPHSFTQWLHFSPHLHGEIAEGNRYHANLMSGKKLEVISSCDRVISNSLVRGQLTPVRQGWISQGYGQITPADALSFTHEGSSDVTFATLLTIGSVGARLEISAPDNRLIMSLVSINGQDYRIRIIDGRCVLEEQV